MVVTTRSGARYVAEAIASEMGEDRLYLDSVTSIVTDKNARARQIVIYNPSVRTDTISTF